ncbi:MAG: hypothetical protein ACK55I_38690, partial [bacterium]
MVVVELHDEVGAGHQIGGRTIVGPSHQGHRQPESQNQGCHSDLFGFASRQSEERNLRRWSGGPQFFDDLPAVPAVWMACFTWARRGS